jgi:hypothetical protein
LSEDLTPSTAPTAEYEGGIPAFVLSASVFCENNADIAARLDGDPPTPLACALHPASYGNASKVDGSIAKLVEALPSRDLVKDFNMQVAPAAYPIATMIKPNNGMTKK